MPEKNELAAANDAIAGVVAGIDNKTAIVDYLRKNFKMLKKILLMLFYNVKSGEHAHKKNLLWSSTINIIMTSKKTYHS